MGRESLRATYDRDNGLISPYLNSPQCRATTNACSGMNQFHGAPRYSRRETAKLNAYWTTLATWRRSGVYCPAAPHT